MLFRSSARVRGWVRVRVRARLGLGLGSGKRSGWVRLSVRSLVRFRV